MYVVRQEKDHGKHLFGQNLGGDPIGRSKGGPMRQDLVIYSTVGQVLNPKPGMKMSQT